VLEITPCARQAQVGLQPFGQPGAAGPDAHQGGIGAQQAAHAVAQLGVQRLGIKLQHHGGGPRLQVLFEDQRGGRGVGIGRAGGQRLGGRVALVHLVHRQPEAAVQLAGEAPGAPGIVVLGAPSGWKGTPTTSASGCHSAIRRPMAAKRASPSAATVFSGWPGAAGCCRWPRRRAGAEIEGQKASGGGARQGGRGRQRPQACPASCDSMRGSKPSSDSARS
jgi:hypothetical protein